VVGALVALASEPRAVGQVFNIGNVGEISIRDLAARVVELAGSTSPIHFIPYDQAYEEGFEDMPRRVPDLSKLKALIGYQPKVQLDEIICRVIEYFRNS
jgi:UDP-glucose 4-epimerase